MTGLLHVNRRDKGGSRVTRGHRSHLTDDSDLDEGAGDGGQGQDSGSVLTVEPKHTGMGCERKKI